MVKKSLGPLCFTLFVLMVIHFFLELNFSFLSSFKSSGDQVSMSDVFFSKLQRQQPLIDTTIVLVDVDTCKRASILMLLQNLSTFHPSAIGVDVLFEKPEQQASSIYSGYHKLAGSGSNIVFACKELGGKGVLRSFFSTAQMDATEGLVNFGNEGPGQPIRSLLNKSAFDPSLRSFALEVLRLYDSSSTVLDRIHDTKRIKIKYRPVKFANRFNAADILHDTSGIYAPRLKGKILLVGDLADVKDRHRLPNAGYVEDQRMYTELSGLEVHALALNALLAGELIAPLRGFWNFIAGAAVFIFFFYLLFYLFEHYEFYFKLTGRIVILLAGILLLLLYVWLMRKGTEVDIFYWAFMVFLIFELLEMYHPVARLLSRLWNRMQLGKTKSTDLGASDRKPVSE